MSSSEKSQLSFFEIGDVAGEGFNLCEIVRGNEDSGFFGAIEEALDQFIATRGSSPVKGSSRTISLG